MPKDEKDRLPINRVSVLATKYNFVVNSDLLTRVECSRLRVTHDTGIPNQDLTLEELATFIEEQRDAAATKSQELGRDYVVRRNAAQ